MCDLAPGDLVVCVKNDGWDWAYFQMPVPVIGATYTVLQVFPDMPTAERPDIPLGPALTLVELPSVHGTYPAEAFRKIPPRNDRLTVEAFSVIKDGGFEEPKRTAPAKRERVS